MIDTSKTICAISTAAGMGAIAVIRISGSEAFQITDRVFRSVVDGRTIAQAKSHRLLYGNVVDETGAVIDEVVCGVYRGPRSFTGEDSVEISCHGSTYIQQQILSLLIRMGCSMAQPGEFTQRAYLNGRMDLSQAESVADLIASSSEGAHRLAMSQMKGSFSRELTLLRSQLLEFVSLIELELDFSEEEVEFADRVKLVELIEAIERKIAKLADSFKVGNAIKNGIPVAIVGETNVGKSTILNMLLGEDRAIVSDVHGTTRDVIEDTLNVGGITFRIIDTAGIRSTDDKVESLGIQRTYERMERASVLILVCDATRGVGEIAEFVRQHYDHCRGKRTLVVMNKMDIVSREHREALASVEIPVGAEIIYISAKDGEGCDEIERYLSSVAAEMQTDTYDVVVTNLRHYEALTSALASVRRVQEGLALNLSGDLLSRDIHDILFALAEITGGEVTSDEVLGNIFKNFCIGK